MAAGKYDRYIRIERLSSVPDTYGQPMEAFTLHAMAWAMFEPLGGAEGHTEASLQRAATQRAQFTLRYREGIEPRMRVVWRRQAWDIVDVAETGARLRELVLTCEARQVESGG